MSSPQNPSQRSQGYTESQAWRAVFSKRSAAKTCSYLIPHLKDGIRILDVGCGPGSITIDLARLVPHGQVIGLDASVESLEQGRASANAEGVSNVEFVLGDAHSMPEFQDGSFDVVHANMVLMHLADPTQALREMRRLGKADGGLVAARDALLTRQWPEYDILKKQKQLYERIARERGGSPNAGKCSHVWAHEAGFEYDQIQYSTGTWTYYGLEERKLWSEGAKNALRKLAGDAGYATTEELDDMKTAWEEWAIRDDAWFTGVDGQILCTK